MLELNKDQQDWVKDNFGKMSIEEKIGCLICPEDRYNYTIENWREIMNKIPLGTCFFGGYISAEEARERIKLVQSMTHNTPLLVAGDLGEGGQSLKGEEIHAMRPMLISAAGEEELAFRNGRLVATQYRSAGFNWTFSPVVDLLYNFRNGLTMNRSFGDNPDVVAKLANAYIRGLQEGGLIAAGAKHFPGDGIDDRDQHRVTSVNSLPFQTWMETYGKVWKSAIDNDLWTIMAGHISLPDYQGFAENPSEALPATLCPKLQIDLLRNELGFKGLLVSDAAPMVGITSRVTAEKEAIANIAAGGDVYLFAEPVEDFERLLAAVRNGELSEERVNESAYRVMETKARVGLHKPDSIYSPMLNEAEKEDLHSLNREISSKGATIQKNKEAFPAQLKEGAKVLCVTVQRDGLNNDQDAITTFPEELKTRGYEVEHLFNPKHTKLNEIAKDYDAIFVNVVIVSRACQGLDNLGTAIMNFWRCFYVEMDNVYFTSFGTPYLEYELPTVPNLLTLYGVEQECQEIAVKIWLGEQNAPGKCPVKMPKLRIAGINERTVEMI